MREMKGRGRREAYFVIPRRGELVDGLEAGVMAVKHADALQLVKGDFAAGVVGKALIILFIALTPVLLSSSLLHR